MTLGLSPVPPRPQPTIIIPQDVAVYKIGEGKFFGPDDTLHPEGTIIEWESEPNLDMIPMNEMAVTNMKKFTAKLDAEGRKVAQRTGKAFSSYSDAFELSRELAVQESKSFKVLGEKKEIPILGVKKTARVKTVAAQETGTVVKVTKPEGN